MTVLAALEAISDQRAVELAAAISGATNALIEAKRRKAAADAAVTNALAEQAAADAGLVTANAAMQALRVELAAELTAAP